MENTCTQKRQALKKALKTLKFFQKVLLLTPHMNDLQDRIALQDAIDTVKSYSKPE